MEARNSQGYGPFWLLGFPLCSFRVFPFAVFLKMLTFALFNNLKRDDYEEVNGSIGKRIAASE